MVEFGGCSDGPVERAENNEQREHIAFVAVETHIGDSRPMDESLAVAVEELRQLVDAHGADELWRAPCYTEISERIDARPAFAHVKWVPTPGGGGRTGAGLVIRRLAQSLAEGISTAEAISKASAEVQVHSYDFIEVTPVFGITVTERVDLSPTAYLLPNQQLPPSSFNERAFEDRFGGRGFPSKTAALVQPGQVSPAFTASHEHGPVDEKPTPDERRREAGLIRIALGLAGKCAVEVPMYYPIMLNPIFGGATALRSSPGNPIYGPDVSPEPGTVREILGRLNSMDSRDAIELSADRLLRSRCAIRATDRMLDLGIADEIALMHSRDKGDGKSEITFKFSTRAAWLIGANPEDRAAIFAIAAALYGGRSSVAHTGQVPTNLLPQLAEFDDLVSRVIQALLQRGSFPNWKALVLGGT